VQDGGSNALSLADRLTRTPKARRARLTLLRGLVAASDVTSNGANESCKMAGPTHLAYGESFNPYAEG